MNVAGYWKYFFIVQGTLNANIVYFQYTPEISYSIKGKAFYVGLQVTQ